MYPHFLEAVLCAFEFTPRSEPLLVLLKIRINHDDAPASSFGLGPIGCVDSCHLLKAVVEAPVIGIRNMLYCLWRGQHDSPSSPRQVLISTGGVSHFRGMALFLPPPG